MNMDTNKKFTSPRAMGTSKAPIGSFGAVGNTPKVGLVSVKGGQEQYKGQKSDMKLPQQGGEGGGKEGKIPSSSDGSLLLKKVTSTYNGPGRFLGSK